MGMLKTDITPADCLQEEKAGKLLKSTAEEFTCRPGACALQIYPQTKKEVKCPGSLNPLPANLACMLCEAKLQAKHIRNASPKSLAKLYCTYGVITVLTLAVVALSVALSVKNKNSVMESCKPYYITCPSDWIGFGSKCFYFSEDMGNWSFSQSSCMALDAHLAVFDSLEELHFLKRYKGPSDHWIGLHRISVEHRWMWTDNTEYNNLVLTRGGGECGFLSDNGISSGRSYTHRKRICSKSKSYTLQDPIVANPG